MVDDDSSAVEGGDNQAAVVEQGGGVDADLFQIVGGGGGKGRDLLAVVNCEIAFALADEDAVVVPGVKKELDGVFVGVAAGNGAQVVADDFFKADAGLSSVDVAADHGERLEAAAGVGGMPDMHGLAVPAEEQLIGAKEDALRRGQSLPYVGEAAFIFGDFVKKRNVMQGSGRVGIEIAEVAAAADPDAAVVIDGHGSGGVGRGEDLAPGDSVVFANLTARCTDEDDASFVLNDGPDLAVAAELVAGVGLEDGDAYFYGWLSGQFCGRFCGWKCRRGGVRLRAGVGREGECESKCGE